MTNKNRYAIISTGGKQFRVAEGDLINVELLKADNEGRVNFDKVLFISDDTQHKIDTKDLDKALVTGEIVGTVSGKKISTLKYKRSHNQCRRWGHRQKYSRVKITAIEASKKG